MLGRIWQFVRDPVNFAVLAAIAGGGWAVFVYFHQAPEAKPSPAEKQIEADCGSVAAGGNISGNTIIAGNSGDCAKKPAQ
jgi:hypothetical protein